MSELTIYTDGSCLNNPGPGGWAFVTITNNTIMSEHFGSQAFATNNQMEMQAVVSALEWVLVNKGANFRATVVTDSRYVQQGITQWMKNWKKNNWRTAQGDPVKNQDYWAKLDRLNTQLEIEWNWVKAHHIDPFNLRVDILARQGAVEQRQSHG